MRKLRALAMAGAFGFLALAANSNLVQAGDWQTVRIATEGAYAPWNFSSADGKLDGFEIDLANDLCRRMNSKCEVIAQNWDGIIPGLNAGRYDAIMAALSITDKRKQVIGFSNPYAVSIEAFAVAADGPLANLPGSGERVDLTTDEAKGKELVQSLAPLLKGKVIGVQGSTTAADFADKYLKGVVEVREYKTTDQLYLDLTAGRIDAIMAGATVLTAAMGKPEMKGIHLAGPAFARGVFGPGVAVGLRKTDGDLKDKLDAAIAAAQADGTISKLSLKWFKIDVSPKQ